MVDSAELIKKVRFPRQLVAFSMVATQAVTFGVMLVILIVLSLVFVPDGAHDGVGRDPAGRRLRRRSSPGSRCSSRASTCCSATSSTCSTAALLPWFFLTPILWNAATLPDKAKSHPTLLEVLRWGNPIAPPIAAVRDAIWSGHLPGAAEVIYLVVAAALALALGAFVFTRVDDRIAVEL